MLRTINKNSGSTDEGLKIGKILLAISTGALLILAFPGFNLSFLAWIALLPLLSAIRRSSPKIGFIYAYISGVTFFLGTIWWLIHVTLPGMIAVVLYCAIYFGIFGSLVPILLMTKNAKRETKDDILALLSLPALWVTLEWIRGNFLTGFPWNFLAHSQTTTLQVIQIADITGAYGVSFLIVIVNISLHLVSDSSPENRKRRNALLIAPVVLLIALGYGSFRLKNIFTGDTINVTVVQGNIPQDQKWDRRYCDFISARYEDLTKKALAADVTDLVIWPETSIPGFLISEPDLLKRTTDLALSGGVPLVVGTVREGKGGYFNSAVFIAKDGTIAGTYDKVHLVPFGEYIPFKSVFSFVEKFTKATIGDIEPGKELNTFSFIVRRDSGSSGMRMRVTKKVKFACLICFEDIFSDLARNLVRNGAVFLVNITNDAWYKKSSAAYQHAAQCVFRAIENRVNVIRAANTGYSCAINQKGRIIGSVKNNGEDLFVEGYATSEIVLTDTRTVYNICGDLFAYACAFITIAALMSALRKKDQK